VIKRISENFVPAAINLYKTRKATNGSRELFLSIQRQKDQYQGIWIVTPDGKVLAGKHDYEDFNNGARELLETIDAGLRAFGPVTRRQVAPTNPLPLRGKGMRPDGGVDLALYGRQMLGGGRDRMPPGIDPGRAWIWDGSYRPDGPTMIDTLTLDAGEWRAFAPAQVAAGHKWTIPDAVARKFVRLLSSSSDQSMMPRPQETKAAELKAKVEAVEGERARVRLRGRWEAVHVMEDLPETSPYRVTYVAATAEGRATWDAGRNAMTSFLLVFDGTFRCGKPDAEPGRTGGVAEWHAP
jgi:hypothetical protein